MEKKRLVIAIPASVISDTPHLREKTAKLGLIGRAAAIFRVDEIIVYRDNPEGKSRMRVGFYCYVAVVHGDAAVPAQEPVQD